MTAIETSALAGALGVEIKGLDVSRPLDESEVGALKTAFSEHKVLVIRDQDLTPESLFAFSKLWGDPYYFPHMTGLAEQPEVFEIHTAPHAERVFGNRWHSDQMYVPNPVKVTMLYAKELPPVGGDTIFSNTESAYDGLSDGMKSMLSRVRIHCDSADRSRYGGKSREEWYAASGMDEKLNQDEAQLIAVHPLIRTHPETGRKCIFIGDQAQRLDGMSDAESQPLIDYLMTYIQRPEFTCRVHWEPGSLLLWDNRCTCHYAVADYAGHTRRMHRVTIAGDAPF
ncbi:MAG: TauD/TfdA family dioxygenase [Rhodospirillales bacterium]|nr:TauD/TfdA family dioxygenase [Rhodospirillales bacterium]